MPNTLYWKGSSCSFLVVIKVDASVWMSDIMSVRMTTAGDIYSKSWVNDKNDTSRSCNNLIPSLRWFCKTYIIYWCPYGMRTRQNINGKENTYNFYIWTDFVLCAFRIRISLEQLLFIKPHNIIHDVRRVWKWFSFKVLNE